MANRSALNSIKIIYEDNHLLVAEKPPNMLSQGDKTGDKDILTLLKEDIKVRYNKPGNVYLGLVHRLDRPVGGVMVFAKTSKAASRLSEQIRTGTFKKTYFAVVTGVPDKPSGTLTHYLEKDEAKNIVSVTSEGSTKGKKAVLSYKLAETAFAYGNSSIAKCLSLVEIDLHTGRPHQIRVQFSAVGNPLYGDMKYGGYSSETEHLALWSAGITLSHPTKNETMEFSSRPPSEYPWNLFTVYKF